MRKTLPKLGRHGLLVLAVLGLGALAGGTVRAEESMPALWGYGVKTCADYTVAWNERDQGGGAAEFLLYREWLSGYVTGLNLATGQDVLVGVQIDDALRRIQVHCDDHRGQDFFSATMDLVKLLSRLK